MRSKEIKFEFVAAELERSKLDGTSILNANGGYTDLVAILHTAVSRTIPDAERQRIVNWAVSEAWKAGPITRQSLLAAMGRLESDYLKSAPQQMVIATTVSLEYGAHLKRVQIRKAVLTFSRLLPRRFNREPLRRTTG